MNSYLRIFSAMGLPNVILSADLNLQLLGLFGYDTRQAQYVRLSPLSLTIA
ncbi:MAG: hypothetical protein JWN45_2698 [Acidobacteriaceae bacterium]|nr:hypothetical protein [Acidobacteriaceae bacterium]